MANVCWKIISKMNIPKSKFENQVLEILQPIDSVLEYC